MITVTVTEISKCGSSYPFKIITQLTFKALCMGQMLFFMLKHISLLSLYILHITEMKKTQDNHEFPN